MNDKTHNAESSLSPTVAKTPEDCDEDIATMAKAIAHPVRVQILRLLASRKTCVCGDIVKELPLAQSTVSEHIRILKGAGLVMGEVDGPRVCYCINPAMLRYFKSLIREL